MAQSSFFAPAPTRRHSGVVRTLRLASLFDLWRSRRALARLDEDALKDVGLTKNDAKSESQRPVWDVPENWRV